MSPYKKRCRSRASDRSRLTIARPKATMAEKKTPMTVSLDNPELRCMIMIPKPTSKPKAGMDQLGSTAKSRPRATPAKAE